MKQSTPSDAPVFAPDQTITTRSFMNRSVAAALLSGLAFPGVGQVYLGYRWRGLAIVAVTLAATGYFASQALGPVLALANEVLDGTLALDPVAITLRLEQQKADNPWNNVAAVVMIVCWIGATVDAWLLGKRARSQPEPDRVRD
jgi:TM2 domain-containing membrane protein YozV